MSRRYLGVVFVLLACVVSGDEPEPEFEAIMRELTNERIEENRQAGEVLQSEKAQERAVDRRLEQQRLEQAREQERRLERQRASRRASDRAADRQRENRRANDRYYDSRRY